MKQQIYSAALYLRLSRDDPGAGDSGSIKTQQMMLERYCEEQGIRIFDRYIDDGFSGLNYDRPAFQRMLEDIKSGFVNFVITKDLSRLGRDYIQTGHYTEMFFPQHGVRYLALNDGVDTLNDNNDIAPFKNILNDMYAKDLSRKVKTAKRTRAAQGAFIGSHPPYGYRMCADNCNVLEIDEEVASVVRRIFHMALSGMGAVSIAKKLREERILTPAAYKVSQGDTRFAHLFEGKPESLRCRWAYTTVHRTLSDRVYLGHMIGHKSQVLHYKTKQRAAVPKSEQLVVEHTHPALVSEEDFERVQKLIRVRHSPITFPGDNIFRGLLFCDECGHHMSMAHKPYRGKTTAYYRCMCHYHYPEQCGHTHYLRYDDLYQLVLRDVRQITGLLSGHMDELVKRLYEQQQEKSGNKRIQAQIDKLEARQEAITVIIGQLYEDFAAGRAAVQSFNSLLAKYQQEQEKLSVQIESLRSSLVECQDPAAGCAMLREAAATYLDVQELDENLLHDLIDRIYIGHRKKKRDKWEQDICIAYQFVGELPF